MGAASAIYVFDHDRYLNCIVPPFRRLVDTGEPGPWLEHLWRLWAYPHAPLSPKAAYPYRFVSDPNAQRRVLLSAELAISEGPAPHILSWDRPDLYELQTLFEFAVLRYCLGELEWTGNANWASHLLEWFLTEPGEDPATGALGLLCEGLDRNGGFWMHGSGGFCEGIHGWLSPTKTKEFLEGLSAIELPTTSEQEAQLVAEIGIDRAYDGVLLERMRRIAGAAVAAEHGVLWANDVYESQSNRMSPAAAIAPSWLTHADGAAVRLAEAMRDSADFAALPILADALEEAGCTNAEILTHCREPGEHVWCCWVVDRILEAAARPKA
jgi:hypothetical protein